jgi:hypothetical protein
MWQSVRVHAGIEVRRVMGDYSQHIPHMQYAPADAQTGARVHRVLESVLAPVAVTGSHAFTHWPQTVRLCALRQSVCRS